MQKPFDDSINIKILSPEELAAFNKEWKMLGTTVNKLRAEKETTEYNEPTHYHVHEIDTIEFLQKGFPPDVCMGFFKGSVIKYTQRADYKNGREDYEKILDFAKRMLDWYDKTHS